MYPYVYTYPYCTFHFHRVKFNQFQMLLLAKHLRPIVLMEGKEGGGAWSPPDQFHRAFWTLHFTPCLVEFFFQALTYIFGHQVYENRSYRYRVMWTFVTSRQPPKQTISEFWVQNESKTKFPHVSSVCPKISTLTWSCHLFSLNICLENTFKWTLKRETKKYIRNL